MSLNRSSTHSLLDADGTTVGAFIGELEDGTFVVTRIEMNLIQDLIASSLDPVAPLAREVLNGKHDALLPLVDALQEADDPRSQLVRGWLKT